MRLALMGCLTVLAAWSPGIRSNDNPPSDARVEAIVFTHLAPRDWDVYLFEGRGRSPRRLTVDAALDYNAVFSPGGRWVVFTSERTGGADLYALDLEAGGDPRRLTSHPAMDDAASFSPDGRQLAFVSTRDGDADIFVMPFAPTDPDAEGRAVNLTRRPGGDFNPAFSPDGQKIAFSRQPCLWDRDGWHCLDLELCVMNADGSSLVSLPRTRAGVPADVGDMELYAGWPAWSPDGTALYYYHQYVYFRDPLTDLEKEFVGGPDIRRLTLDGHEDVLVAARGYSPAVGPQGRIGFVRPLEDDRPPAYYSGRVYSVAADRSDLRAESPVLESWLDSCFAPDFHRPTGRMVCHGQRPGRRSDSGFPDGGPSGLRRAELPDRSVELYPIAGYFPALTSRGTVLSTLHIRSGPLARQAGRFRDASAIPPPSATVGLYASTIDGSDLREVFHPSSGIAWGAHVASDAGWAVAAVGPTFGAPDENADIWKFRLDGSEATNLTSGSPANEAMPNISADGQRIVFRRPRWLSHDAQQVRYGEMAIFVMDGRGENQRRLTTGRNRETMPAISPDGEWVAYVVLSGYDVAKIWLSRWDGSDRRLLEPERADIPDLSLHPRFSPDGQWVVFTSDRGGLNDERPLTPEPQPYGELYAVPVAGGSAVRLTHDKWEDGPNDWGFVNLPTR